MKINKKQFNKWLFHLYNETYPQGIRRLQTAQGYCCLGVGCKVLIPEKKLAMADKMLVGGTPSFKNQPAVPKWLQEIDRRFEELTSRSLSGLNDLGCDSLGSFTHPEIAMLLDLVYNHKMLA